MKYEEALAYLEEKVNPLGSVLGLSVMTELLNRIGNPQNDLKIIHVAGTNGKGSVSALLASVLKENGYRVGRYLSPSVLDYREKIQVNGNYIPGTKVAGYLSKLFEVAAKMKEDGFAHPTSFELETAMAFMFLKDKKCDYCIVEVGMGGREDATNVIASPLLCILTSISLDHVGMIGNTQEEIAETKAGIIKDKTTVISAPCKESVASVIRKEADKHEGVSLSFVKREDIKPVKSGTGALPRSMKQVFTYGTWKKVEISLLGEFQPENAAIVLAATEALQNLGVKLKEDKIRIGLARTVWPCRFEILGRNPVVIADGAHNPDAVLRLMKTVDYYFTNRPIIYIMGVLKDKAVDEIIGLSAGRAQGVITVTPPNNPRGLSAFELAKRIREVNPNVSAADSVEEALEVATLMAGPKGVVLAFGSLSYLGRLKEAYGNGR